MKYETRFAYPPVIQTNRKFVSREPSKRLRFTSHQLWKKEKRELFRDELQPLTWIPFVYGYLQTVVHTDTDFGTKAN